MYDLHEGGVVGALGVEVDRASLLGNGNTNNDSSNSNSNTNN